MSICRNITKNILVLDDLTHVIGAYHGREFKVSTILSDNEFSTLKEDVNKLWGITLNITSREEHIPLPERKIRVIKERFRSLLHSLPYRSIPRIMIVSLVVFVVIWLKLFPSKSHLIGTLLSP